MSDIAVQASFNSGEWAPALFARVDITKYRSGAALLENFFVDYRGGASSRPGTRFIYPAPNGPIRLIPFQLTSELGYVLVFTNLKLQFISRGAVITENSFAITAATQANPCVITVTGNNFVIGDLIFIENVSGMIQLDDRFFIVSNVAGAAVTLHDIFGNPVDATGYTAYTSGGTSARIYTLVTPYRDSDLVDMKYAQNVSQMIICTPGHQPNVLEIITANNWTLNPIFFGTTAATPGPPSISSSLAPGSVNYAYLITSIDANGQESNASPITNYLNAQDIRSVAGSISISWSAVAGAVFYNVYKADVSYIGAVPPGAIFGFIGFTAGTDFIDSNIAPDFTQTPPVATNPFTGGGVTQTSISASGTYTSVPTVSVVGTATVVASIAAVLQVHGTPTVGSGGTGYVVGDTVLFTNNVVLRVATLSGSAVATWEPITSPHSSAGQVTSGSTPANPVTQVNSSGAGTGATANLTWGVGYLTILNGGAGYTVNPTAVFSPAGATAVLTISVTPSGNPTVPGFFQQRLVLASTLVAPQTFYMSKPGQFFNFDVSFPTRPDDAITETLVAGVLNTIESIVSSTAGMLLLTDHGSWIVNGGSSGSAISPTAIVANAQSFNGSKSNPPPIVANYDVLYPQQKGSSVRDLSFNIYFNVFTGTDISILPSHLFFGYQITDWTWAEEPFKVVWAIRNDGVMLSCTYMKEQEFVGWAHHITTNGSFKTIASVTEPDEEVGDVFVDGVYVAVSRTIPPPFPPPPPPPPGPPPVLTHHYSGFSPLANNNLYTNVPIGTPAADRLIVVTISGWRSIIFFRNLVSVTIGGNLATIDIQQGLNATGSNGAPTCAIASLLVPTGTQLDITVTWDALLTGCCLDLYSITGLSSFTADAVTGVTSTSTANLSTNITVQNKSIVIATESALDFPSDAGAIAWTGLSVDSNQFNGASSEQRVSAASDTITTATIRTVSTSTASGTGGNLVVATWH